MNRQLLVVHPLRYPILYLVYRKTTGWSRLGAQDVGAVPGIIPSDVSSILSVNLLDFTVISSMTVILSIFIGVGDLNTATALLMIYIFAYLGLIISNDALSCPVHVVP
jgi:hypothetical protein